VPDILLGFSREDKIVFVVHADVVCLCKSHQSSTSRGYTPVKQAPQ
jgi:hypothetical protein